MAAPVTTALPSPPSRTQPANFSERADAFLGALPQFQSQLNSQASWMDSTSAAAVAAAESARDLALSYRNTASTHATTATTKAGEATTRAATATAKAGEAAASAAAAKTSETNATTSETKAKTSETNAKTSETNAASSRTAAATSATNANSSKTAAETAAGNAKTSETNAAGSAAAASGSAATASTKAGEAAASATAAAGSSSTADGHRQAAQAARSAAEAASGTATGAVADFNAKWYGSRSTAPTGSIAEGALYFNTAVGGLHIRKGGAWVGAVASSFDELWALIKSSDGHNSGLDADTVDGLHANQLVDMVTTSNQAVKGTLGVGSYLFIQGDNNLATILRKSDGSEKGRVHWESTTGAIQLRARNAADTGWSMLEVRPDGQLLLNGVPVMTRTLVAEYAAIGSTAFLSSDTAVSMGTAVAGSSLFRAGLNSNGTLARTSGAIPGTWECRGVCPAGGATTFTRIA